MTLFKSWQTRAFLLIALVGAFKIFYNATLPLHFDEAYYWMMSRHLGASYFDIPPMLAYLIALTGWLGEAEWMIRLVSVFCAMGAAVFVFLLARDIYDEKPVSGQSFFCWRCRWCRRGLRLSPLTRR